MGPLLFLIYFNDFERCLKYSSVYKFADDTVIFLSSKHREEVENRLNLDLQYVSTYFRTNELVINLKPGKTESMLFSTSKKLSSGNSLNLKYDFHDVSSTSEYKYLGTILDQTLSFNTNFHKSYKKASRKLRLLWSLKCYIPNEVLSKIYEAVLLPGILYNCTINLNHNATQLSLLSSIDRRICRLTEMEQTPIINKMKKSAVILVKKFICGHFGQDIPNLFTVKNHGKSTRNNGFILEIPLVKLQLTKSMFRSMGVTIYNDLPLSHRQIDEFSAFKEAVSKYFK